MYFCMTSLARKLLGLGQEAHIHHQRQIYEQPTTTKSSPVQHTKQAVYQGGYVWGQALVRCPFIPSPETYGWQKSATQEWQQFCTLLPEAVASCSELLKCGCKKGCRGLCKCVRAALKCTSLCHCSGNCDHNDSNSVPIVR